MPEQARWHGRLAAWLIWFMVRAMSATIRFRMRKIPSWFPKPGISREPMVFCIWHNRLALCLELHRHFLQRQEPRRRLAAIVSASRDGGLLTRVLELFRVQPVRGSTSRRGPQALLEMTGWAERGLDLAVTPDGPRGPKYSFQDGAIALAQVTGHPIVVSSYDLNWKIRIKSWDTFMIPLPFARCDVSFGEPVHIPRECSPEEREKIRKHLEDTMRQMGAE